MRRLLSHAAAILLLTPACAFAQVRVSDPWVRATVPQQKVSGAFMRLFSPRDARLVEIRSPVAGVISRRVVESGDRVKDGDLLFELVNTTELEFDASVPSEFAGSFGIGAPVALAGQGLPADGVSGRVARINPAADASTRQVKVYVAVPNRGGRIVAGVFASGRVVQRQVRNVLAVPREAIRAEEGGKTYVLIVLDDRIERRDVTVGAVDDLAGLAEIASGLAGGETVVVGPAQGLRPGQPVSVTEREG